MENRRKQSAHFFLEPSLYVMSVTYVLVDDRLSKTLGSPTSPFPSMISNMCSL